MMINVNAGSATCSQPNVKIRIERSVYTQDGFQEAFQISAEGKNGKPTKQVLQSLWRRECYERPSRKCMKLAFFSIFPCVRLMVEYDVRRDLMGDIVAGLTVAFMHIPQGMAYSLLANLKPQYGLYTSMVPVILYFFFGTSKHISLGVFAVICLMIGKVVSQSNCMELVHNTTPSNSSTNSPVNVEEELMLCYVDVATALTFMVGLYQIVFGLLKFGFITVYLSEPLTRALTAAASVHVATSQLGLMFGVSTGYYSGPFKLVYTYITLFRNLPYTNIGSLLTCLISMLIIYCVQTWINPKLMTRFKVPIPIELLVLILGIVLSYCGSFHDRFGMDIIGVIPSGVPMPHFPNPSRFASVAGDAIGITILNFAMVIALGKLFAKKYKYEIHSNQEWLALGASNVIGSFLNCFVSCPSMSRTVVREAAGGKTQLASLISSCVLLVTLLAISPLFYHLPKSILAAVVIVNLRGMLLQVRDVKKLHKNTQYVDLTIWIVTAVSVVLLDVELGLYIGIGLSILTVLLRTQRPSTTLLGRIPETEIYRSLDGYNSAAKIPGVHIFRFASPIHYANAEFYAERIYYHVGCNPIAFKKELERRKRILEKEMRKLKQGPSVSPVQGNLSVTNDASQAVNNASASTEQNTCDIGTIILDFSSVIFIDSDGVSVIMQLLQDYSDIGCHVLIACCQDDVHRKLDKAGVFKKYTTCITFVGIHDAVLAAAEKH